MSLQVESPGVQSLLVDAGRTGARSLGVPMGGAADRAALAIGNALIGNDPDTLALEITLAGPTLRAQHHTACVVFGAPFLLNAGNRSLIAGTTFTLEAGEVLRIGGTPAGVRGYFCVAGGFVSPLVLGSRSALAPIQSGDLLISPPSECEPHGVPFSNLIQLDSAVADEPRAMRVLDGLQREWFPDDRFFSQSYEISPSSNRMGLRLVGEPLVRRPGELVSEAVAPGAVQITNDGQPIVLGVDGQTIGGYPKIAHVIRADLDRLAQLRPGEQVRFVRVALDEAGEAAQLRKKELASWCARLNSAERRPTCGTHPD